MTKSLQPFLTHAHTHASNFRLRDCINKPQDLLDYCLEIGLPGVVITDHEILSAHVKAYQHVEKNRDKFGDFQLSFGNEIYLVDRNEVQHARENNEKIHFHHFILIAKNNRGYEALRKLSSIAWSNSFFFRGMERVPTYYDDLISIMQEYQGDLIASTACVGGSVPQALIQYKRFPTPENKQKVHNLIVLLKGLFGDDLYFELQPSHNEDQLDANEMLLKVGKAYGVKCIVATDAHYLNKKLANAHKFYLQSSDGDREVDAFYATTYVMDQNELLEYFEPTLLNELISNTHLIKDKIQPITFAQETQMPHVQIPEYTMNQLFVPYYMQYEYIRKYSESIYEEDKYYLHLIAEGMINFKQEMNEENLSRINVELKEMYYITEALKQPISSYFILSKDVVDIMWEVSLVGVSRGSACCFYVNYLLDIVQLNPIKYNLPHWRFLTSDRPELPDIDLDSEGSKRAEIIRLTKEKYGEENVLNMGTVTTEGPKSAVLTACRGLGIDKDIAHQIASMIPTKKNALCTVRDAILGNELKAIDPVPELIQTIDEYEGLRETLLAIDGIISGRGQHASGVIIFPNGYVAQNAMMKTTSGLPVTQFDMHDSAYMGGLKLDYLSIKALDKIRAAMDLLLEHNEIEWQGTLRKTYNKYFHPDVLELEDPKMWELLYSGHVLDAFQFETPVGQQALAKINPRSFDELCAGNSLMRLSSDGEQPLDKYVKFKNNRELWHIEMKEAGLNEDEMKTLEDLLHATYGICDTQEGLMILSMSPKISGFNLTDANKFRKDVAKPVAREKHKLLKAQEDKFFESGLKLGNRKEMLRYTWEKLLKPQFGYAFSAPHVKGYTMVLMIEMNICHRYGSIYWKTACLSTNAGLAGEDTNGTSYGKLAKAVGDMKGIIFPPDINRAKLGFTPVASENKILFGLKPIVGLGMSAIEEIIKHRPYTSFDQFLDVMNLTIEKQEKYGDLIKQANKKGIDEQTKITVMTEAEKYKNKISDSKVVTLIKSGSFDEFNPDRRSLMIHFIKEITPKKEKLTMVQLPKVIHIVDQDKYKNELAIYNFRNKISGRNKIEMNNEIESEFIQNYSDYVDYDFDNGKLKINEKSFQKFYELNIVGLKEFVTSKEAANEFNKIQMQEFWKKHCLGTIESWEMESILFYTDKHELDDIPLHKYFNIVDFNSLPYEPVITGYKTRRGKPIPEFKIETIAGTVVEKDKGKGLLYVATNTGVVTVRYSKGQFKYYDNKIVNVSGKEKVVLDDSWFKRGTLLVFVGLRRGEEFVLRKNGSRYNHTTMKIRGYNDKEVFLQMEKMEG